MEGLQLVCRLGAGSYATVYRARQRDGTMVAVKELKQITTWDELLALPEVRCLRLTGRHDHLVSLLGAHLVNGRAFLIMDLCDVSLLRILTDCHAKGKLIAEPEIRCVMRDIATGLSHLHGPGVNVMHRDLKPENVLIGRSSKQARNVCKICDFGQASQASRRPLTPYVATRWYRAPELLIRSDAYSLEVDCWALGCLMAEMYLGRPLFPGTSEADQLFRIVGALGSGIDGSFARKAAAIGFSLPNARPLGLAALLKGTNASADAIAVMDALLQIDPARRPSAKEILAMPFFSGPDTPLRIPSGASGGSGADDAIARAAAQEAQAQLEADLRVVAAISSSNAPQAAGTTTSFTSGISPTSEAASSKPFAGSDGRERNISDSFDSDEDDGGTRGPASVIAARNTPRASASSSSSSVSATTAARASGAAAAPVGRPGINSRRLASNPLGDLAFGGATGAVNSSFSSSADSPAPPTLASAGNLAGDSLAELGGGSRSRASSSYLPSPAATTTGSSAFPTTMASSSPTTLTPSASAAAAAGGGLGLGVLGTGRRLGAGSSTTGQIPNRAAATQDMASLFGPTAQSGPVHDFGALAAAGTANAVRAVDAASKPKAALFSERSGGDDSGGFSYVPSALASSTSASAMPAAGPAGARVQGLGLLGRRTR